MWIVGALIPSPTPAAKRLPWNMFSAPRAATITIRVEGRVADGAWRELPIGALFRFSRGATGQRLPATARALQGRGHEAERRAFAEWVAAEVAAQGRPVSEVRIVRESAPILGDEVRTRVLGSYAIAGPGAARSGG
ncbi:MAG: hypothetical protein R3A79_13530 [Nannocystaceae bacterium]